VPVNVDTPSGDQSFAEPHAPVNSRSLGNSPTAVLQCASRNAWSPPAFCVRQTRCAPTKIVFETTGSVIVGVVVERVVVEEKEALWLREGRPGAAAAAATSAA
jgi:hypothetical protein